MSEEQEEYGIAQAQKALAGGGTFYPQLKLGPGDRAWFWSLSGGKDKWFAGAAFHAFKDEERYRQMVCMRSLNGSECHFCNDGHSDFRRMFALWVFVEAILHNGDNPEQDGEGWPVIRHEGRTLFKEVIGEPMVVQLSRGREGKWFNMFVGQFSERGSLQTCKYQLTRFGTGLDTEYELKAFKAAPPALEIIEKAKDLPSIQDLFKGTIRLTDVPRLDSEGYAGSPEDLTGPGIPVGEISVSEVEGEALFE